NHLGHPRHHGSLPFGRPDRRHAAGRTRPDRNAPRTRPRPRRRLRPHLHRDAAPAGPETGRSARRARAAMTSLWQQALERLPDYLGQHVLLSVSAILLGLAISLPLALASVRSRRLRAPMLAFANDIQTIPGLALLALFYPLLLALSAFTHSVV